MMRPRPSLGLGNRISLRWGFILLLVGVFCMAGGAALAAESNGSALEASLWLEEVESDRVMAWVGEQNQRTMDLLRDHPRYAAVRLAALEILEDEERIPDIRWKGGHVYQFLRQEDNPRGLWRRSELGPFLYGEPVWEILLDLDELAREEGEPWVWEEPAWPEPVRNRVLLRLSRGGADAVVLREFDLRAREFVVDGFVLPESKSFVAWHSPDELLLSVGFDSDSTTRAGYGRKLQLWRRGTELAQAPVLWEADIADVAVWGSVHPERPQPMVVIHHARDFHDIRFHLWDGNRVHALPLPEGARIDAIFRQQVIFRNRESWVVQGQSYPGGSLLAVPIYSLLQGEPVVRVLWEPTERESVETVVRMRDRILFMLTTNLRGRLFAATYRSRNSDAGEWQVAPLSAPAQGTLNRLRGQLSENRFFYEYTDFLTPSELYFSDAVLDTHTRIHTTRDWFPTDSLVVRQWQAISTDGESIPYFLIAPRDLPLDGTTPTLLTGYGGFSVSQFPHYSALRGLAWLNHGYALAIASIRGGGEFGPAWHQAALRENRQVSIDDFLAVAEDLQDRGVTKPRHLGILGASHGGLLVGTAMVQRPDLFGAVVAQAPILDLLRYHHLHAGASWMAEYGDPDNPDHQTFLTALSPLHQVRPGVDYPPALFLTSTRDDRVHPAHARRMVAQLQSLEQPAFFHEFSEGGHAGAVHHGQRAQLHALFYAFFHHNLSKTPDDTGDDATATELQD